MEKGSNCQEIFSIYYKDKIYTGYWSLCAAINRGIQNIYQTAVMSQEVIITN